MKKSRLSYLARAESCSNPVAKKLLQLMQEKQSNLALSADITNSKKLITLVDQLGPEICVLKTHIDIIEDFSPALTVELQKLAHQHRFIIFEDRKFADIGNTVKHQYQGGIYHIADWADIINAHVLPGPGIIAGLAEVGLPKQRGLLLLAEMSSAGNLLDKNYTAATVNMAKQHKDFVIGFISQHKLSENPEWIYMTPGVQLTAGKDALGQRYATPEQVISVQGSDIIIVGRDIVHAADPLAQAKIYRARGWAAYQQDL